MLMATDTAIRKNERSPLIFFTALGAILTIVELWRVEKIQIRIISFHDWMLVGFFPIFLLSLSLRTRRVKKQPQATEKQISLPELDLDAMPDPNLVGLFKITNYVMWFYVAEIVVMHVLRASGISV
jgi:hypothetical protein